jgi:hypothetical protein
MFILIIGNYIGLSISKNTCLKEKEVKTLWISISKPFLDPDQFGYWLIPVGLEKPHDNKPCEWYYGYNKNDFSTYYSPNVILDLRGIIK